MEKKNNLILKNGVAFSSFFYECNEENETDYVKGLKKDFDENEKRAITYFQAELEKDGYKVSFEECKNRIEDISYKMLFSILAKYPDVLLMVPFMPKIHITTGQTTLRKAKTEYNAWSYYWGKTSFSYGIFSLYRTCLEKGTLEEIIDVLTYMYFHELGHHMFRLYVEKHFCISTRASAMLYTGEYYADAWAFTQMGVTPEKAAEIIKKAFIKLPASTKDKIIGILPSATHPSLKSRCRSIGTGRLEMTETIIKSLKEVSPLSTFLGLNSTLIQELNQSIDTFKTTHPDIPITLIMS